MKNAFSVSPVFDARGYRGNPSGAIKTLDNEELEFVRETSTEWEITPYIPEDFQYPYTFILGTSALLFSFFHLPSQPRITTDHCGMGFKTVKAAESHRKKIIAHIKKTNFIIAQHLKNSTRILYYDNPVAEFPDKDVSWRPYGPAHIPSFFYLSKYKKESPQLCFEMDFESRAFATLEIISPATNDLKEIDFDWSLLIP